MPAYNASWRTNGHGLDHSKIQRPVTKRLENQMARSINNIRNPPPVVFKQTYEWSSWPELSIRLDNLHNETTTYDLWRSFECYGNIVYIGIYERNGERDGNARLKFSPPPTQPFWTGGGAKRHMIKTDDNGGGYNARLDLDRGRANVLDYFTVRSPVRPHIRYNQTMKLVPSALIFGVLVQPTAMMSMEKIPALPQEELSFTIDFRAKQIVITFMITFKGLEGNSFDRKNKYRFEIPFAQLKTIGHHQVSEDVLSLVITLDNPPAFFRKREEVKMTHTKDNLTWSEFDMWIRQTDIVYDPYYLQNVAVTTLQENQPVIDIGRWTTYNFVFSTNRNEKKTYDNIKQALLDFNIEIVDLQNFTVIPAQPAKLWALINHPVSKDDVADPKPINGGPRASFLPFESRYQLEVCISREILNEHNISAEFVAKLLQISSQDASKARNILEYLAEKGKRIYEPMAIFEDKDALAYSAKTDIPDYCAYSRKATITPTTVYFSSPTVETTNRVLRNYARENKDGRFLRVQFTDEQPRGRINSCADKQKNDELFTRVYRTLFNGITIGDRHYEFLAFGNSQFRENGAYFFCPTNDLSCDDIRGWMGNFTHIKVVAKYAARLGQCFSTTRAIKGLSKPDIVKIPDVDRNGYCFTDGVGKISPYLAEMITAELGLRVTAPPSAFQFRLGGCKGMLVVSPDANDKEVHIRKSQQKFTSAYNGLEIIRWSRFSAANLNRQTITILSSLGVPDEVFLRKLTEQLANYQSAMSDDNLAQSLLSTYVDDNNMTINIATMINNGFMAARDPFVLSLLHLWRAWSIKLLKEKAKIIVEDGAFLFGCVDETSSLRGYIKPTIAPGESFSGEDLPQIFVQIPAKADSNKYNVIEGICLVGRNPSLHPGDLRVVQAVNIPALHHLRDVVVFPQTGDRDVPSMCSGGDLDGDDFFVIWDKELQPPEWNCDPMNYAAPEPKSQHSPVQVTDLMKFFVRFMKNDSLPAIAHAHLANSDYLTRSVKDPKCLELAALHSRAVDYVKTGQPAEMPKRLRAMKWPHFMEKKHMSASQQYHSDRILGQLYDRVESVDFKPQYEETFDTRILRAYELDDALLKVVRQTKSQYDTAMLRIMAQHEIDTEFEVWSTFILAKPRVGSDYKVQEVIANVSEALKDQFQTICIERAGGKEFSILGPFVAGMYQVTKEEMDIALNECNAKKIVNGREVPKRKMVPKAMPLISFPWLFEKELARIATGIEAGDELESHGLKLLEIKGATKPTRKSAPGGALADTEDFIQQEDGKIVHRGEELDLFRTDGDSEELSSDSDFEDARARAGEPSYVMGNSGELVVNTTFQPGAGPEHIRGGTGVEDVVPQPVLDGFLDPRQTALRAHGAQTGNSISSSSADMMLLNKDFNMDSTGSHAEEEEEMVELIVGESQQDKLARLMAS